MKSRQAYWTTVLAVFVALIALIPVFENSASAQQKPAATAKPAASSQPPTASEAAPAATAQETQPAAAAKVGRATPATKPTATPAPAKPAAPATTNGATPPSKPAATTAASGSPQPVDAATYTVRLRDLESKVDELKEQIRRSHTRLSLLSDTILSGGIGGAQAEILFRNEMSNAFRVTQVLFVLDGVVQYKKKDDSGVLSGQKEIPIFSGAVPPGDHTIQVVVGLQGHGYGVFSYLRGYKFEVKSTHSFTVTEGKSAKVEAVAWEKGGVTTPLEQRPNVRFTEKMTGGEERALPGAGAP